MPPRAFPNSKLCSSTALDTNGKNLYRKMIFGMNEREKDPRTSQGVGSALDSRVIPSVQSPFAQYRYLCNCERFGESSNIEIIHRH